MVKCGILTHNTGLDDTITNKDSEGFILAKSLKNKLTKTIEKEKMKIMKKKLSHVKNRWKVIDSLDEPENLIPTTINYKGELSNSPKRIGEMLGNFYNEKIETIRSEFDASNTAAMETFEYLIPKPNTSFSFKTVSTSKTYEVITKLKLSNAKGNDEMTSRIMRECPHFNALAITHIFNSMIRTKKYPQILKTARIVPLLKKGKDPTDPNSFRPVSNLLVTDKVIESLLKEQMEKYFEDNFLIPDEHHGCRTNHSTMTCKMSLDSDLAEIMEERKHALVISTDLTAAMDVVEHKLLLEKMNHMGVSKDATDLMESFLSNRFFIIDIQGFYTNRFIQPPCSIIQGSRFSGFLMSVSTLEVPLLPKVMMSPELASKIAGKTIERVENTSHLSQSYIDDNSNVIGAQSHDDLVAYTQNY